MRHRDSFISQSLKNIRTPVNHHRTSAYLFKEIIKQWVCTESQTILVWSTGDEVLALQVLKKMKPDSRLVLLEADPVICNRMSAMNDERLLVIPFELLSVNEHVIPVTVGLVDCIISTNPFIQVPEEHLLQIIKTFYDQLNHGGKLIQVQYSSQTKKLYEKIFGLVQMKFLPFNSPPAFLLTMSK